jgi:hypothetical protein
LSVHLVEETAPSLSIFSLYANPFNSSYQVVKSRRHPCRWPIRLAPATNLSPCSATNGQQILRNSMMLVLLRFRRDVRATLALCRCSANLYKTLEWKIGIIFPDPCHGYHLHPISHSSQGSSKINACRRERLYPFKGFGLPLQRYGFKR